jgi:hypothetical protein
MLEILQAIEIQQVRNLSDLDCGSGLQKPVSVSWFNINPLRGNISRAILSPKPSSVQKLQAPWEKQQLWR